MGIVEQLRSDAEDHIEVANSCDCNPQDTVNWRHAENAREAATDGISSGLVAPHDHPDFVGGIVWSECELAWINKRISDAEALISAKDAEIERLEREASACDLLEEQKGTITALNMALGGEDSTSTENLIDAHDIDYNEEGLISLCRKLIAENVRLSDVIESTAINDTIEALGFANREIERLTTSENDWITCHAKIWRELQETKTIVGNQAERISDLEASPISEEVLDILRSQIKALEYEITEQCRINGIGAEREAALHGLIDRQSAALKLASLALTEGVEYVEEPPEKHCTCHISPPCNDCVDHSAVREFFTDARKALAAINEVLGE